MIEIPYYFYLMLLGLTSVALLVREQSPTRTKGLYIFYSIPLVVFAASRPFFLMRDDEGYVNRFHNILSDEAGGYQSLIGRDPLWTLVTAVTKLLWDDPRTMLIITAIVLTVKLFLLYRIATHNKLLVLFMYTCMFWQLHDLTQFRVSMAEMFFLFFIYKQSTAYKPSNILILAGAFAAHAQALPSFVLFKKTRLFSSNQFLAYLAAIVLLLAAGLFPDLSTLGDLFLSGEDPTYLRESYQMYHLRAEAGLYSQFRNMPVIFVISVVVYGLLARELKNDCSSNRIQLAFKSIALGATLAFLFASVSDVQVRFYEFFFLSGLVLASTVRTGRSIVLCYFLALCYFTKFNVTWSIWEWPGW